MGSLSGQLVYEMHSLWDINQTLVIHEKCFHTIRGLQLEWKCIFEAMKDPYMIMVHRLTYEGFSFIQKLKEGKPRRQNTCSCRATKFVALLHVCAWSPSSIDYPIALSEIASTLEKWTNSGWTNDWIKSWKKKQKSWPRGSRKDNGFSQTYQNSSDWTRIKEFVLEYCCCCCCCDVRCLLEPNESARMRCTAGPRRQLGWPERKTVG